MFIDNKYTKVYYRIVENAANKKIKFKTQWHHVIPLALGGSNHPDNLVHLTHKEHFICHHLLTKMTEGRDYWSMVNAFQMLQNCETKRSPRHKGKIHAKEHARLKEDWARGHSRRMKGENNPQYGRVWTDEEKAAHSAKIKGRVQPLNEKEKQSITMTGRTRDPFSEEWRANLSKAKQGKNNNMYGKKHSEETKKLISEKAKLRKQSAETRAKISASLIGTKKPKKHCPHCQRDIAVNGYARFHGDKCKLKS